VSANLNETVRNIAVNAGGLEGAVICLRSFLKTDIELSKEFGPPSVERLQSHVDLITAALDKYGTTE
jgi:hypothetical protein